ncbi:hypothetical protein ICV01_07320 [Polynucleobacter sp. MWH-Spelu-300-X4]|uniref:hypothetical protein n=1 Tax=Polynucleobacter sp. MWH-Spelu-300-X4 TaxID=2689109 RepID=UPI001BFEB8DB|nr:hypothetical protein [Polynucleobacter sp. MWH-Spelu-300-X4]QWD79444.1 hypothetical protein ICV01_07320 [Polynucleobacter sp. MWH-Spelu-300-X4]
MDNIQAAVNTNSINTNFAINLEEFAKTTGAEITVSGASAEQQAKIEEAQQILRDLEKASVNQKTGWYDVRAQYISDGTGPAEPIAFESLIGEPRMGDIEKQLDELAAEYGRHVGELQVAEARSNKFLIGMVGKCHDKYAQFLKQSIKEQKRIVNRIDAYMLDRNINVTSKTYTLSKLLMCVFVGADAKKINSYYSAIAYAQKNGCLIGSFEQYVQECGGLQAMRLANAQSKKSTSASAQAVLSRDEKLAQATQWANAREIAVFDSEVLAQNVDATAGSIVLIATPLSGGKYAVRAGLSDKAVVDAALLAFYKASKEAIGNGQEEQEHTQEADQIDQLAAQAAAMAE